MSDEVVKIKNVIQPELFTQYVIDRTTEKSLLIQSGAIQNNPKLNQLVNGGGTILTMPSWNDLVGDSEVLDDGKSLTPTGITSKSELATLLMRGHAWGANDLAGALAGDDPMKAIASLVGDWWVRDEKKQVMSILKGVFLAESMAGLKYDGSKKAISGEAVLDAKQLMGDASDSLTMIYMHSALFTELQKQNMIQFIPVSESKIQIPTYLGYRVVCDDSAPVAPGSGQGKVYTSYLLSAGCIQRGVGTPVAFIPTETDRDSLAGVDYLINRQAKVLHPKGLSWIGSGHIAGVTPTNAELEVGTNWERKADIKKIGMVEMTSLIPNAA